MTITRRDFLKASGLAAVGLAAAGAGLEAIRWAGGQVLYRDDNAQAMHLLNRMTWGPRPADLARLKAMGVEKYVDWQLRPEEINDPVIDDFLKEHPTLSMTHQELYEALEKRYEEVYLAMLWGRVYRAVNSARQLHERMVELWTDHFNVPIVDLLVEKTVEDREVVRKHALGNFHDLLLASARSPAMLSYLNNASSNKLKPNENYARELMELHTLGVDGGYTERDVKEVARAFTGWTVSLEVPGMFYFDDVSHDYGEKTALGHTFPAGQGVEDGLQVLKILADHPSTARYVSRKLCRHFVSDDSPQSLVQSAAQVFTSGKGDIRRVVRHILLSGEALHSAGQKFRRPLDYLVAIMRVTRPRIDDLYVVYGVLEAMGQIPFHWHAPNGYPDAARAWMNTNGLLNRWGAAMLMAGAEYGEHYGVYPSYMGSIPKSETAAELVDNTVQYVFGGEIDPADRKYVINFVSDHTGDLTPVDRQTRAAKLPGLVGLLLSSPYFQWR